MRTEIDLSRLRHTERELHAARELCHAQYRKIQRLQRQVASLERQLDELRAEQSTGYQAHDSKMLLDAV